MIGLVLAALALLQSPEETWKRAGCAECHGPGREGGDILKNGPLWSRGWIKTYLARPGVLRPGSKKQPSTLPEKDRDLLATYIFTLQKERMRVYSDRLETDFETGDPPPRWDPEASAKVYAKHCAPCHGAEGKGDGPLGDLLGREARPRDFSRGRFRRKEPALQDVYVAITRGMPGSAMAAFGHLTDAERWGLSRYVIGLGPEPPSAEPYRSPDPPPATPVLIEKGAYAFLLGGCQVCHGADKKGVDRGTFFTWEDEARRPIHRSRDLTAGIFRTGSDPRSLYRAFFRGRDGTPMPTFGEFYATEEDRWALVWFVKSLSDPKRKGAPEK